MRLFTLEDLVSARTDVGTFMLPTPAHAWPLVRRRSGVDVVVKHENHTPTGSFKARGAEIYMRSLLASGEEPQGIVTATRGNHGQSVALAATRKGLPCIVVVPEGNSEEKNAAMQAFGAEVVIAGADFDESRDVADKIRSERDYHAVPSFHRDIVRGVSTYALEFLSASEDLDTVYVPIGMGSGICGMITVRDLLGLKTKIVGVVADGAPAYALSVEAGGAVSTNAAVTFADGIACRDPQSQPLDIIRRGVERVVRVSDAQIADAIRILYTDTHNLAEGAGAAALAAMMTERQRLQQRRVGVVLTGGNIDMTKFRQVLAGRTPAP